MRGHDPVASIGETVILTGGRYPFTEVEPRLTNKGPQQCQRPALYWVSSVRRSRS
jgi:hypothetical protein